MGSQEELNSRSWEPVEEEILVAATKKLGFGNIKPLRTLLPDMTELKIELKVREISGMSSLEAYKGLHLDLEKLNSDGCDTTMSPEECRTKYELSPDQRKQVIIPFFRRNTRIAHLKDRLDFLVQAEKRPTILDCYFPPISFEKFGNGT